MTTARAVERNVAVNGLRLRYLDWGTAGRTPLICLHGHTGQAHIWDEFAQAMSAHFHVLAVDQRGHGESDWAHDGYDRSHFVADLAAFVDALGLERVVLCGLSMGGWNSLLYAAEHPKRAERIILVDIGPESSEEAKRGWAERPPRPIEFASLDQAYTWARTHDPWATEERLRRDLQDQLRRHGDGRWRWRADPVLFSMRLRDEDPEMVQAYYRALETIPCPILEVRGLESNLLSDDIRDRMLQRARNLSWADVAGAGHVVTVDRPQEFIRVTRPFLGV